MAMQQRLFEDLIDSDVTTHKTKQSYTLPVSIVLHAIVLGADRIGHGQYGINRQVLREAARRGVIFEVNPRSNEILGFTPRTSPLAKLLGAGVGVVVSTDGAGIFRTSVPAEIRNVGRGLNLSRANTRALKRASKVYVVRPRPRR